MASTFDANSLPPGLRETRELVCDRRAKPDSIEDLWRRNPSPTIAQLAHIQSENLEWWVTKEEVSELLNDDERLGQLVGEFASKCLSLGMTCQSHNAQLVANNSIFVNPGCPGCNNPYDAGGCQHVGSPNRLPMLNPDVNKLVHETLVMLSVINYLLVEDHLNSTNKLALKLAVKIEDGFSPDPMLNVGREVPPITLVLGLMDNCSRAFPKVAHYAAGLLSLLIVTNPASAFSCLDGKTFADSTYNYFGEVFGLVHNSECMVEEYFGVVAYLNILPALYHFGMWNEAKSSRMFNVVVAIFVSITLNICHGTTSGVSDDDAELADLDVISDPPRDLQNLPEMLSAKVFWESLLLVRDETTGPSSSNRHRPRPRDWRIKLLHDRTRTFAVLAGIEVLGWWSAKGIDLSRANVPVSRGPAGEISDFLRESLPRIRLLIRGSTQNEELSPYIERMVASLLNKRRPKVPSASTSLLHGPFYYDSRRCGLCHKTESEVGHVLLICGGGCCGLEQYCSKKHQRADWKKHKFWCKKNATYTQYAG
ncbi:hypothetical protein ACHAWF_007549 [Thalassiosira exigua]